MSAGPRTLNFSQTLDAADRAAVRVEAWPEWKRAQTKEGKMMRVARTPSGDIDVARQLELLRRLPNDPENLREVLHAVWYEAYVQGWSDGTAGRDPKETGNPYTPCPQCTEERLCSEHYRRTEEEGE